MLVASLGSLHGLGGYRVNSLGGAQNSGTVHIIL